MLNLPKVKVFDTNDSTKLLDRLKADIEGQANSVQGYWKLEDDGDFYNKLMGGYDSIINDSVVNTSSSTSIPHNEYSTLKEIELKKGDDVSLEEDEKGNIVYSEDGEIINLYSDDIFIKINGDWVRVHLNNIKCKHHYDERPRVILEFII